MNHLTTKNPSFHLPLVDLASKPAVAAMAIDHACRETGFFLVKGHGINLQSIEDFYGELTDFFNSSLEEKIKCKITNKNSCPYGYTRLASENAYAFMGEEGPNDYVEKLSAGPDILNHNFLDMLPKNEKLQCAMKKFYLLFQNLGFVLGELFALAIDLPVDFIKNKMQNAQDVLRCLAYPTLNAAGINNGFAPHTDMGLLTIVSQNQNGLEMLDKNNTWQRIHVPSLDTFVINIGDLMMRWSNDEWLSNKHRVVLNEKPRLSTAFFKVINNDVVVDCFPKFCQNKPAQYQPVLYSDFATDKMNRLFNHLKSNNQ